MAEKELSTKIKSAILDWAERVVMTDLGKELVLKGRTSDAKKSRLIADCEIKIEGSQVNFYMPNYWQFVEYGVAPQRIPYNPNKRTGAGTSKYISALLNFLVSKGKSSTDPRTKNIAFAIATKQTRQGNPIDKAKLNFISATILKHESKWSKSLEEIIGKQLETVIFQELSSAEKQIKI